MMATAPAASPVLVAVAGGKLPICFEMSETEVTSLHRPLTVFCHAARQSYLPLVSMQAASSFQDSAPQVGPEGLWFSTVTGQPLRWDLPIGLLFDEHGQGALPWRVQIRFRDFPSAHLLKSGLKETERAYFHSLKQALNLLTGSATSFIDMRQHDQEALWQAVEAGRFLDAWRITQTLLSGSTLQLAPVRLVSSKTHEVRQAPIAWQDTTLRQAVDVLAGGRAWSRCVVQGVNVPLDALVSHLVLDMAAPDLFLYVCVDL